MEMLTLVYLALMYLNCVFEVYLLDNFMSGIFPICEDRKSIRICEAMGCVTAIFMINQFNSMHINLIFVPVIFLFYVWLIFRLEAKYSFLYVLFYYVLTAVAEFSFHYVYKLLGIEVSVLGPGRVIILIVQNITLFMIIQVIKKQHRDSYQSESYQYLKRLFLPPITTLIVISGLLIPLEYPWDFILSCFGGILLIISNIVDFSTVETVLKAVNSAKDAEMAAMKSKLEQHHYQRLEELNQDYAKYIHEMKRIIQTMEHLVQMSNNEEIKKLAEDISYQELQEKNRLYTMDHIMNAIFVEREKAAADLGIKYEIEIQPGIDLNFVDDLDKISLYGNLLDNALEAAAGAENGYISIALYEGNDLMVIFRIENNFKTKPLKVGQKYVTSKQLKKDHGFGLKMVNDLATKYNGILNLIEEENQFTVMLILPIRPKTAI